MVRLTFSNQLEPLAAALLGDLQTWRDGDVGRQLTPLPIAVPDRLVARYLNLHVARHGGIAVNLRFPYLSGALTDCLGPTLAPRLLTRERITERLAIVLADPHLMSEPVLAPVCRFIETGDAKSAAARRAELAAELGRLFLDYALTRPDDFITWSRPISIAPAGHQGWQQRLWRAVTSPLAGDDEGVRPRTLIELIATARDDELSPPEVLFVVGGSSFARGHRLMLERLSPRCDVRVYAFNPCREYWEDLERSPQECPPLAYWGRAGRAPVRQLGEMTSFDFETSYDESDADTVLARIATDVRDRTRGSRAPLEGDQSVRIVACPSVRRELEVIADRIWTLAREDSTLHLCDVGVLLAGTDRDLYRAQVSSVFSELGQLPHHIIDIPLLEASRAAEAVAWLLELPLGHLTRPELLRVLTHPRVSGASSEIDPSDWIDWVRDLGIFFGADEDDHAGTYLPGDLFHWDQGLLRLGLGACVERDVLERPIHLANRIALPHPQPPDQRRSAGRLALLARSLLADIRWLRTQRLTLSDWCDVLWRFASAYVTAEDDREAAELGRVRSALLSVADPAMETPLELATAIPLAQWELAALRTRRGEPLTEGVCVAPLGVGSLTPFRHLFIAGLSSGTFPALDPVGGLDVRAVAARADEPTPRDRDRYGFLHALLAARESLTCTYVGRDAQSGERVGPSSVVAELQILARRELSDAGRRDLEEIATPWAHTDAGVESRGVHLSGRRRARALELGRGTGPRRNTSRRRAIEALRAHSPAAQRQLLGLVDPGAAPTTPVATGGEVSTAELARFLGSPLDAWASSVLGIGSARSHEATVATEPLDLSPLEAAIIKREAVCGLAIDRGHRQQLQGRVHAVASRLRQRGTGPAGVIASWHRARALDEALHWWDVLEASGGVDQPTALAVGRARESAELRELLPPLILDSREDATFEIHGAFPLASEDGATLVYFLSRDGLPPERVLRGLVDHCLLAGAQRVRAATARLVFVGPKKHRRLELTTIAPEGARALLEALAIDLFGESHAYDLPGDLVVANHLASRPLGDGLQRRRAPSPWVTVPRRAGDFDLPPALEDILARRYEPLLSLISEVG